MVIVFGGEKGGTGKSALSINMAVCMVLRGRDVMLIDGDKQRTSAKWAERRGQLAKADATQKLKPVPCMERRGDMLAALESMAPKYDHIIIDVAGAESPQLTSALAYADVIYSPFVPSEADLETAESINHAIDLARVGNPDLRSWTVLNQVAPRPNERGAELRLAAELMEPYTNLPLARTVVSLMGVIRKAHTARRGVVEFSASPHAKVRTAAARTAGELWALYTEITGDVVVAPEEAQKYDQPQ